MILSDNIKKITLYKLDKLLREIIVQVYLKEGLTEQTSNKIYELTNKIHGIANKIYQNKNIELGDLMSMENLFGIFQPDTGSVAQPGRLNSEKEAEFNFKGK